MKNRIILQVIGAAAMVVTAGISAAVQPQTKDAGLQCSVENKKQYYADFQENYNKGDQDKAFADAKKYLGCPSDAEDQEDALANLNFSVGRTLSSKTSNGEAIPYLIKAASYNSPIKTSPLTYYYLGSAYEHGPYTRLADIYTTKYAGKDETKESLQALDDIYHVVDRMIDAYARAVALAGVKPGNTARSYGSIRRGPEPGTPTEWMEDLTDWYKFRHNNSDAGIDKLIETILSKPLPDGPLFGHVFS